MGGDESMGTRELGRSRAGLTALVLWSAMSCGEAEDASATREDVGAEDDDSAHRRPKPARPAPLDAGLAHDASHGEGGSDGGALPAEVCKVLQDNACLTCHQGHGHGGAPMGLTRLEDFRARALDGSQVAEKVLARMQDPARPMPPTGTGRPLPKAADVALLRTWIERGMAAGEGAACEPTSGEAEGPAWARTPWPAEQCEHVLTIGAHAESGKPFATDPDGFAIPKDETYYHCFYEKVPWGSRPMQALAIRARVEGADDEELLHHMQLSSLGPNDSTSFLGAARPTRGGEHKACANPNGSTIGTWAPGALNPVTVPSDTGVLMPSGDDAYIELQVHYHNGRGVTGRRSRAAFDICVTSKLRPNTAAVHTLGFENSAWVGLLAPLGPDLTPPLDNKGSGVGTGVCTAKQRARILSIAPHMHELGRRAKVEIVRRDGRVEVIHDQPFRFDDQTSYLFDDLWIEPGERIRTTCTWDPRRKLVFGFASQDEMCFVSTLAYPAGALAGVGDEKGLAGGDLSCAGLSD